MIPGHSVNRSVGSSTAAVAPRATSHPLPARVLTDFIARHYRKNRTIVSRDIPPILDDVARCTGVPVTQLRYRTGEEHGTWVVPPQWDVREAWVRDADGRTIATYADQPLLVAPYSASVRARLTRDALVAHTFTVPRQPDAFGYNWRFAMDARLRLRDWGISLPQQTVAALGPGPFDVCIDAEVVPGDMRIGVMELAGATSETLCFLADYCHPGQVNDSFSGLALFMRVMHALAQREHRRYTYRFLMMPETIGAAVYLAADPSHRRDVLGSIFAENVGYGGSWYLKATRRGNTYMDLLAAECQRTFPDVASSPFVSLTGNDEYMFDAVQVGIPSLALLKYPFPEYHTSNDTLDRWNPDDFDRAFSITMHLIDTLERDEVYVSTHAVPFWMSRYQLFADAIHERDAHLRNFQILYHLLDGTRSTLQIAHALRRPFAEIATFLASAAAHGLVHARDASTLRALRLGAVEGYASIVSHAPVMDAHHP